MKKKEEPGKRARELFGEISNLQLFINKYSQNFETLTPREVEMLTMVANGEKKSDILQQLEITEAAFSDYQAILQKKLLVQNQADYIKFALAFGLITF